MEPRADVSRLSSLPVAVSHDSPSLAVGPSLRGLDLKPGRLAPESTAISKFYLGAE